MEGADSPALEASAHTVCMDEMEEAGQDPLGSTMSTTNALGPSHSRLRP